MQSVLLGAAAAGLTFAVAAAPSAADIVSTTSVFVGDINTVSSFGNNQVESDLIPVFKESSVTLGSTLDGVYTDNATGVALATKHNNHNSNGSIAAGTGVDRFLIRLDNVNNNSGATYQRSGSITFDRPILGVIWTTGHLIGCDDVLGAPGVAYSTNSVRDALGGQGADEFTLSSDLKTIDVTLAIGSGYWDELRVLTEIPEPTTAALLGLGGFAVALRRSRR